jgi:hypothetical protein
MSQRKPRQRSLNACVAGGDVRHDLMTFEAPGQAGCRRNKDREGGVYRVVVHE